jgi:thiosulfate/3-mercaptopyruvate sulfurtransferase
MLAASIRRPLHRAVAAATPVARAMASSLAAVAPRGVISTTALADMLPSVTLLDASWYLPSMARDGRKEYEARRIPGARFFDINAPGLCDTATTLPHMLPRPADFGPAAAALGISKGKPVVVYDGAGLFSAARVFWTLKAFGHPSVAVLSGGLPAWAAEGRPLDTGPPPPAPPAPAEAWALDERLVRTLEQVAGVVADRRVCGAGSRAVRNAELLVDARSAGRFEGTAPEPRPGLPAGHVPTARNVPFTAVLDAGAHNALLPPAELARVFAAAGVDVSRPGVVTTGCGSGVTGAVLFLALHAAGRPLEGLALYDGSWTEWASRPGTEIAVGPAEPGEAAAL